MVDKLSPEHLFELQENTAQNQGKIELAQALAEQIRPSGPDLTKWTKEANHGQEGAEKRYPERYHLDFGNQRIEIQLCGPDRSSWDERTFSCDGKQIRTKIIARIWSTQKDPLSPEGKGQGKAICWNIGENGDVIQAEGTQYHDNENGWSMWENMSRHQVNTKPGVLMSFVKNMCTEASKAKLPQPLTQPTPLSVAV
jgi:hypothetical protein